MRQVYEPNFEANNMTVEIFRNVIKKNLQLIRVKLQGVSEPFINKNFKEIKL